MGMVLTDGRPGLGGCGPVRLAAGNPARGGDQVPVLTVVTSLVTLPAMRLGDRDVQHPVPPAAAVVVAAVVHVSGDLDVESAPLLRERLAGLLAPGGQLVIDGSGIGYCDTAGLAVLGATRSRARAREGEVHLVAAGGTPLGRLLRAAGWASTWPPYADVDAALAAAAGVCEPRGD